MVKENKEEKKEKYQEECCSGGKNYFLAIILLLIGIVLLLNNFGFLSWEVWYILWKFWPLILVFWGVETILDKSIISRVVMALIAVVIGLLVIIYSISIVDSDFDRWARKNYPMWGRIKRNLPEVQEKDSLFECSPFDENCYRYLTN